MPQEKKQCQYCKEYFSPAGFARWHGEKCVHKPTKQPFPFLAVITLFVAASIASVSAWYSILGLTTIFAGAAFEVAIMASALEVGKLTTTAWLHFRWNVVPTMMKAYLTSAVVILMFITSIGIFGLLSKAHIEQTVKVGGNNDIQIATLQRQIARQQDIISDAETVLSQLDESVQTLIDAQRIRGSSGSIAIREAQKEERASLNDTITDAYARIEELSKDLLPLQKEQLSLEAEVGPLKYLAELVYGSADKTQLDQAVRWLIILLVVVMDPLAVLLTIAGLMSLKREEIIHITKPIDALVMS